MKTFDNLKAGQVIVNKNDNQDTMKVVYYNYYGDGEILCFETEQSIYPSNQFDASDWEIKL